MELLFFNFRKNFLPWHHESRDHSKQHVSARKVTRSRVNDGIRFQGNDTTRLGCTARLLTRLLLLIAQLGKLGA